MKEREAPAVPARSRWLTALLVALVLMLVAGVWAQGRDRGPEQSSAPVRPADIGVAGQDPEGTAGSAVLAARAALTAFFDLDPAHARRQTRRAASLMTGDLAATYRNQAHRLVRRVERERITRRPTPVDDGTATEYLTDRQALVLVTMTVRTTQPGRTARVETLRSRVGLTLHDGVWLASSMETLT